MDIVCNLYITAKAARVVEWIGPYTIGELLAKSLSNDIYYPLTKSVYLISVRQWGKVPTKESFPLYVGSNPKNEDYFKARLGLLIGGIFGFYEEHSFHSGARKIFNYCRENNIQPLNLYIGWLRRADCSR